MGSHTERLPTCRCLRRVALQSWGRRAPSPHFTLPQPSPTQSSFISCRSISSSSLTFLWFLLSLALTIPLLSAHHWALVLIDKIDPVGLFLELPSLYVAPPASSPLVGLSRSTRLDTLHERVYGSLKSSDFEQARPRLAPSSLPPS